MSEALARAATAIEAARLPGAVFRRFCRYPAVALLHGLAAGLDHDPPWLALVRAAGAAGAAQGAFEARRALRAAAWLSMALPEPAGPAMRLFSARQGARAAKALGLLKGEIAATLAARAAETGDEAPLERPRKELEVERNEGLQMLACPARASWRMAMHEAADLRLRAFELAGLPHDPMAVCADVQADLLEAASGIPGQDPRKWIWAQATTAQPG